MVSRSLIVSLPFEPTDCSDLQLLRERQAGSDGPAQLGQSAKPELGLVDVKPYQAPRSRWNSHTARFSAAGGCAIRCPKGER